MSEKDKIEVFERGLDAWNRGELTGVTAELSKDHEWDLSSADIPGETGVLRGHEEYLRFAGRWRDMLGPTQLQTTSRSSPSRTTRRRAPRSTRTCRERAAADLDPA